jgi:hypothetical protein
MSGTTAIKPLTVCGKVVATCIGNALKIIASIGLPTQQ